MSVSAENQEKEHVHCTVLTDVDAASEDASEGKGQIKPRKRKRLGSEILKEQSQAKRRSGWSLSDVATSQGFGSDYYFDGTIGDQANAHFGDNIHNHYNNNFCQKLTATPEELTFQHLLGSLAFSRMGARERIVKNASPATCEWFFELQDFKSWIDNDKMLEHCGFLWIKGKPGTGKSTIMKRAKLWIDDVWPDQITLSYFFNARSSDTLEKSTIGLWRSLVHQLLTVDISSRADFLRMFTSKIVLSETGDLGSIEPWEELELQNWLAETICRKRSCPPSLNIFIDALDEGHDDEVLQMVGFLEELASRTAPTNQNLRICLSSRHYPHIHIRHGLSLIVENQQGHTHDIEIYVLNNLRGTSSKEMNDLRTHVVQRSQGIFLWVVLVIPLLNRIYSRGRGITAMAEKLQELPKDLHDLFAALLSRDPDGIEEVATLLHWVLYSLEPITSSMLQIAIQQTHQLPTTNHSPPADPNEVEIYLLNCSRGLVEAVGGETTRFSRSTLLVQFIHQSVRDFLTGTYQATADRSRPIVQQVDVCHAEMAKTCLRYLNRLSVEDSIHSEIYERWQLAPYAAKFWWQHMKLSGNACDQELKVLASEFLCRTRSVLTWLRIYDIDYPIQAMTAETQLCAWDLEPSLTAENLRNPIYYAVATGILHLLPPTFEGHAFDTTQESV